MVEITREHRKHRECLVWSESSIVDHRALQNVMPYIIGVRCIVLKSQIINGRGLSLRAEKCFIFILLFFG